MSVKPGEAKTQRILFFLVAALSSIFALQIARPDWFLPDLGSIDPFIYWTSVDAFNYAAQHFGDTYYFRRWPLFTIDLVANAIGIDAVVALNGLAILKMVSVLVLAGMLTHRLTHSPVLASVTIAAVCLTPLLATELGSTLHAGPVVIYLLGSAIFAESAFRGAQLSSLKLYFAGVAFALGFVSYPAIVMLLPIPLVLFLASLRTEFPPGLQLRTFRQALVPLAVGFLSISQVLDPLIGRLTGHEWEALIPYSAGVATGNHESRAFGQTGPEFFEWLSDPASNSSWTLVGLFVAISMALLFPHRTLHHLFAIGLVATMGLYLLRTGLGAAPLKYAHTLAPLGVIIIIALQGLVSSLGDISNRKWLPNILVVGVPVSLLVLNGHVFAGPHWALSALILTVTTVALFLGWFFLRDTQVNFRLSGSRPPPLRHMILVTTVMAATLIYAGQGTPHNSEAGRNPSYEPATLRLEVDAVARYGLESESRLWIWDRREWPRWSPVISSLYGLYSALAVEAEPEGLNCDQVEWLSGFQSSKVVIISGQDQSQQYANHFADLISECGEAAEEHASVSWTLDGSRFDVWELKE